MTAPSRSRRIGVAVLFGSLFALITWYSLAHELPAMQGGDFTYPWLAARFVLRGQDPYSAMRNAVAPFGHALLYPLPAAFVAMPLAWLSAPMAGVVFVGIGVAWLAYSVTREGWWRLIMFASAPAYRVTWSVQWAPFLMACALTVPALGLLIVKPNVAVPLVAFQSSARAMRAAMVGGLILTLLSLAFLPTWPLQWIAAVRSASAQYRPPMVTPLGSLVALAVLRWRRPEGRLLLSMALMPQNGFFYDQFPLLLIPRSRSELVVASLCSLASWMVADFFLPVEPRIVARSAQLLPLVVAGLYLPALVMVIRRPNEGPAPMWLERFVTLAPTWLRGRATPRV